METINVALAGRLIYYSQDWLQKLKY